MKKTILRDILCAVALAVALAAVFRAQVFAGKTFAGADMIYQNYPRMAFVRDRLSHGEVPLWAPHIYAGYPLAAEGQAGVFYPPNLILMAVPQQYGPNAVVLSHIFLCGMFMFIFGRAMGLSRRGAMLAGLVYAANGFVMSHTQHSNIICALAWPPLMLALAEIGLRKNEGGRAATCGVLLGAAAAMMFLAGQPQFAAFGLISLAVFFVFRAAANRAAFRNMFVLAVTAGLCAALLSAVQLLPELELIGFSIRPGGLSLDSFTNGSLHPKMFMTFLLPHVWGAAWDGTFHAGGMPDEIFGFIGLPALVLAAAALFNRKHRAAAAPLVLLAALSLPWAVGGFSPAGKLLFHIPVINMFRVPARALFFFVLGGSFMAGAGLDYLAGFSRLPGKRVYSRLAAALIGLGACVSGVCAGALILLRGRAEQLLLSRADTSAHPPEYYAEKAALLLKMAERDLAVAAAALILVWIMLIIRARRAEDAPSKAPLAAWALVAIIALDFCGIAPQFVNSTGRAVLLHTPKIVETLKKERGFSRVYTAPPQKFLENTAGRDRIQPSPDSVRRSMDTMDFELPLLYGVNSINGYGSLSLWDFQTLVQKGRFVSLYADRNKFARFGGAEKNAGNLDPVRDRRLLGILKVRHVIRPNAAGDALEVVDRKPVDLSFSPFWATCKNYPKTNNVDFNMFFDPAFSRPELTYDSTGFKWSRPAAGRITVEIDMPCDGALLLMEKYYPGWKVYEIVTIAQSFPTMPAQANARREVEKTGDIFLGIGSALQKGKHKLEYVFEPELATSGLKAGLTALAAAFLFLVACFVVRRSD